MRGIGSSGRKLRLRSVGSVQLSGTVYVKGGLAGRAEGLNWLFLVPYILSLSSWIVKTRLDLKMPWQAASTVTVCSVVASFLVL